MPLHYSGENMTPDRRHVGETGASERRERSRKMSLRVDLNLKSLVRTIPDYPKPGIMFRDITTLLKDASGFKAVSYTHLTLPTKRIV